MSCLSTGVLLQNPAVDQPEDSRLLSLLANVLEAMVDATEQREHARLHARLQVSPLVQLALSEVQQDLETGHAAAEILRMAVPSASRYQGPKQMMLYVLDVLGHQTLCMHVLTAPLSSQLVCRWCHCLWLFVGCEASVMLQQVVAELLQWLEH
jgi:truncated hemoglobin YjbI